MRILRPAFALTCAALALAAPAPRAQAQPVAPNWEGDWLATEASQGSAGARVAIARQGGRTVAVLAGGASCQLVYDEANVTPAALLARVEALRSWQLDPRHWPEGTDPAQLVGLIGEFDRAARLLKGVAAGTYRRVRLRGPDCEPPGDSFWLLHRGQDLLRLHFPEHALGVSVTRHHRRSTP